MSVREHQDLIRDLQVGFRRLYRTVVHSSRMGYEEGRGHHPESRHQLRLYQHDRLSILCHQELRPFLPLFKDPQLQKAD